MTRRIDYFFSIGSPWAYLGLERFLALASGRRIAVEPRVIPLIEENGGIYARDRPLPRRAYWTEDLRRWAHVRGVPLRFEGREALGDPAPAGRVVIAAALAGLDWARLTGALQRAFWTEAADIGDSATRRAILTGLGLDADALEAGAGSAEVAARAGGDLALAKSLGVFGVPTYAAEGQFFWGQDSLPFLERHLDGERLTA